MSPKTNKAANQNAAEDSSKTAPTGTSLPTGANPASTEPPCVSNQDNAIPKKTEVTPHNAAKGNYQLVPIKVNLPNKRSPRLKLVKHGNEEVLVPDTTDTTEWDNDLASTFGSTNPILGEGMIKHIAFAATPGDSPNVKSANFVLSFVSEAKPRDPNAANLAVYSAGLHEEIMKSKRRLGMVKTEQQLDGETNRYTKLLRTACHLALTSKNYDSAPAQTVTVQNVSVSEGGQAIVGNVTHGTPSAAGSDVIDGTLAQNDNQKEEPDAVQPRDKGEGK